MSREIKFRIWNPLSKELMNIDLESLGDGTYQVNRDCLEQFTGLKDSNSVEIYEGDIVNAFIDNKEKWIEEKFCFEKKNVYWSVEFVDHENFCGNKVYGINRRFNAELNRLLIKSCEIKVIGNIHQHSHLLEGK